MFSSPDESNRNHSRMTREVAGLRRKLADIRVEVDKCRGYQDDLEDCKVTHEDTLIKTVNFLP